MTYPPRAAPAAHRRTEGRCSGLRTSLPWYLVTTVGKGSSMTVTGNRVPPRHVIVRTDRRPDPEATPVLGRAGVATAAREAMGRRGRTHYLDDPGDDASAPAPDPAGRA